MKRLLILSLLFMIAVSFTVTASGTPVKADAKDVVTYDTVKILWSDVVKEDDCLMDQLLLDKFGIKFNIEYLSRAVYKEKMPIMLATGEGIEVIAGGGPGIKEIKQWALDGYLTPIGDYVDQVPNYRKHFSDEDWKMMIALAQNADGKLYWLPAKRSVLPPVAEVIRAGSFKKIAGIVPQTTDELYTAMKKVKAVDPDAVIAGSWAKFPWFALYPFRAQNNRSWYMDPDSKKIEFGPSTEKYLDALIYAAKMFGEGLTDQEWTPAGKQHWMEIQTTQRSYLLYTYGYREKVQNDRAKAVGIDDAGWLSRPNLISAYPGKGGMADGPMPIMYGGPFITTQCAEDKIPRFMEYLNWAATDEGIEFIAFGKEGETFQYDSKGVPRYMSHILTADNSEGRDIALYGVGSYLLIENAEQWRQVPRYAADDQGEWAFEGRDYYHTHRDEIFPQIAWDINEAQEKEMADLQTVITDVSNEWTIKFITGILDPNDKSQWDKFQTELKKVGLDKVRAIREEAIKTSTLWQM